MRKILIIPFFTFVFIISSLAQTKPHSISIGSSTINDFDDFGWYSNVVFPLKLSSINYVFTFNNTKNHLGFSVSYLFDGGRNMYLPEYRYDILTPFGKEVGIFKLWYIKSIVQDKIFDLQAKIGIVSRFGSSEYFSGSGGHGPISKYIPFKSSGIVLGGSGRVNLPLNMFIGMDVDFAYYAYIQEDRLSAQDKFTPPTSLQLSLNLGYQFRE